MEDKEKRVKELASDMDFGCTEHDLWPEDAKEIAKALVTLGYQKVREDDIIISKDEYERLNQAVDSVQVAISSFSRLETLYKIKCKEIELLEEENKVLKVAPDCEWCEGFLRADAGRLAAEKILKSLWKERNAIGQLMIFEEHLKEKAKEFGIEIEELCNETNN